MPDCCSRSVTCGGPSATCGAGESRPAGVQPAAEAPTLGTKLTWRDRVGGWGVRWGIGRDRYRVEPGLYRIGRPSAKSPVLATANYKLTVDALRRHLGGLDAWLLILDTRGVNVWCAAGKGTFGTRELVRRIMAAGLKGIVDHRTVIVPQLGATGVAAHEVKLATGFQVRYGPVLARDLPAYLAAGMVATPLMRRVPFGWRERLVVAPVELVRTLKPALAALLALVALDWIRNGFPTVRVASDALPFLGAVITGGLLVPLLLPWLPFRAFTLKGVAAGAAWSLAAMSLIPMGRLEATGTTLLVLAITSYMAMTFTGSTTFTSLAGARLEVRRGLRLIQGAAVIGVVLRVTSVFV